MVSRRRPTKSLQLDGGTVGGRWTKEEDSRLRQAVEILGSDWTAISVDHLGNSRTEEQCRQRWTKVLQPGLVKGPWTKEEDQIIMDCIQAGETLWSDIACKVTGRLGKQCRERWFNHLDPSLKKGEWSEEEDAILIAAQRQWGNCWTKIAKLLPGRSENASKNRWNSATLKQLQQQQPSTHCYLVDADFDDFPSSESDRSKAVVPFSDGDIKHPSKRRRRVPFMHRVPDECAQFDTNSSASSSSSESYDYYDSSEGECFDDAAVVEDASDYINEDCTLPSVPSELLSDPSLTERERDLISRAYISGIMSSQRLPTTRVLLFVRFCSHRVF